MIVRFLILTLTFIAGAGAMRWYDNASHPSTPPLERMTTMRPVTDAPTTLPTIALQDEKNAPPPANVTEHAQEGVQPAQSSIPTTPQTNDAPETGTVAFVYDGDTFRLADSQKVRLIGIDTPEMNYGKGEPECYAKEAKKALESLVLNKTVTLVKDTNNTDRYGRLLRYVYVDTPTWGSVFVNNVIVGQGFGISKRYPPDITHAATLDTSMQSAQTARLGLWAVCNKK